MQKFKTGFTLIELLVVIAIIGVLSSIMLVSLKTSRDKSKDAAIEQQLNQLRPQGALYYAAHGDSFAAGDCITAGAFTGMFNDSGILPLITALKNLSGAANVVCNADGSAYAVSAKLVFDSGKYWCVDSAAVSRQVDVAVSSPVCPSS